MKYEFMLKVKDAVSDQFHLKFHCVCDEKAYDHVKFKYESYQIRQKNEFWDSVLLIDKLDDAGNFLEIVQ